MATRLEARPPREAELRAAVQRALASGGEPALLDHLERLARLAEAAAPGPEERVRLRGYRVQAELLRDAGGVLSTREVARRLGLHPASVARLARERRLLGLREGQRWYFPRCQFDERGRPVPHLDALLHALPEEWDGWHMLDVLLIETDVIHGVNALEAARRGRPWLDWALDFLRGYGTDTFG